VSLGPEFAALGDETGRRGLLQGIVELTRSVFAAKACSIMSHDPAARELVFEAVAGEGAGTLVGRRIPATTGLAGWSLASEEPIAISDVTSDPRFAREVAEQTGFVPTRMSVHPLLYDERSLGVLSVLDQGAGKQVGIADMNVLARIATHAAAVLALVQAAREAETAAGSTGELAGIERALASAPSEQREAALAVLAGVQRLLAQ
jgi:GAF domain-containing protein